MIIFNVICVFHSSLIKYNYVHININTLLLDNMDHINMKVTLHNVTTRDEIYTHDFNLESLFGSRGDDLCCRLNQRSRKHP